LVSSASARGQAADHDEPSGAVPSLATTEPQDDASVAEWRPGSSQVADAPDAMPKASRADQTDPGKRARNLAIALGPGFFLHGSGQRAAGNPAEARSLLSVQAAGLGLVVVGLGGLAATGASRYTAGPLAATMIIGAGMFGTAYLSDVYATARPHDSAGLPPTNSATSVSEIGHRYVYDPQFRYRHFLVQRLDARIGRFTFSPQGWFALDDDNARITAHVSYRFSGPLPSGPPTLDGSYWDLSAGASHHRYDSDGFRILGAELLTRVRRDLLRYGAAFRGAFVEGALGVGLLRTDYDIEGTPVPSDYSDLLLAELAMGMYFGDAQGRGGEARLYYDHRHDGYASGLHLTGLGSGVAGHFGLDVRGYFTETFGLRLDAQVGSSHIVGLSLLLRQGKSR
jgi:hypothetical protein